MANIANAAAPDPLQAEGGGGRSEPPAPPAPPGPSFQGGSKVYKSGSLFLSSKGIGWTSWKKRWFILTQTSLVFYRSDPNAVSQKWSEVNLTLGGIDLNSSGSVVVKEDKKLITVLFSDGRDGRAFTLKAETLEDLHEWKNALEEALSNAPSAATVGQNGIFTNDQSNGADASSEQLKDRLTAKSLVIGRPVLLALEDVDGTPSFLEKALLFLEENGIKTEGILRQAADVEDVERRIQEYEKGKTEFSPEEDPHVIGDCVKYVLRELPSSPVPASCCKALLEACRVDRSMRILAVRSAICETFPEPNRCLLQRILTMMQAVASNKAVNLMSISAVAACMAPLLLRPLLAGECDIENNSDAGGDGSVQLLRAAAAANHAQAIVIFLLEEYDNLFGDHAETHEPYTDSEESGSYSEEMSDDYDDESFDDDVTENSNSGVEEESENGSSSTYYSETGENRSSKKVSGSSGSNSSQVEDNTLEVNQISSPSPPQTPSHQHDNSLESIEFVRNPDEAKMQTNTSEPEDDQSEITVVEIPSELSRGAARSIRRPGMFGRAAAKKNLSMESIDLPFVEETEVQNLESVKDDLKTRISNEAMENSSLQNSLEQWKHDLHERRLALENDVGRLQEQLQKEMDLRVALEAALRKSQLTLPASPFDEKTMAELEEVARAEADVMNLKTNADDLESLVKQQREQNSRIRHDISNKLSSNPNHQSQSQSKEKKTSISRTSGSLCNRSKDSDKPENKQASLSSINRAFSVNQQADASHNPKRAGTMSRKSSTRGEGTNSTTSALSKLTNRLNFLKERRSQIASELQNLDKGRSSSQPVQNPEQQQCTEFVENSGNQKESKGHSSSGSQKESKGHSSSGNQKVSKGHSSSGSAQKESKRHASSGSAQKESKGQSFSENYESSYNASEGVPSFERGKSISSSAGENKGHSKFPPKTQPR